MDSGHTNWLQHGDFNHINSHKKAVFGTFGQNFHPSGENHILGVLIIFLRMVNFSKKRNPPFNYLHESSMMIGYVGIQGDTAD